MRSYLYAANLRPIDCWEENIKPYDNETRLKLPAVNAKECHLYLHGPRISPSWESDRNINYMQFKYVNCGLRV